jgi:hypothetical protein
MKNSVGGFMIDIVFDKYGYAKAESLCAPLVDREGEMPRPGRWIRRMCDIPENGIEFTIIGRKDRVEVAQENDYDVIAHKPNTPKDHAYLANKSGLRKLAKAALARGKKVGEAEALLSVLDETPVTEEEPSITEVLSLRSDLPEVSSLQEILKVEKPSGFDMIYSWKGKDVILSQAYASWCNLKTKQVNRQIKKYASQGVIKEGVDFIRLRGDLVRGFCEVHDVHLTPAQFANGLYLLTQLGVNNVSSRLANERAKAMTAGSNMAAAVIQDLERNGVGDVTALVTVIRTLSERCDELGAQYSRLVTAFEEIEAVNRMIAEKLGGGTTAIVRAEVENALNQRLYPGDEKVPPNLISTRERRKTYFPAINDAVVSEFLFSKAHPRVEWAVPISDRICKVATYERSGMENLFAEFFRNLVYVKTTNCYHYFSLERPSKLGDPWSIAVAHKRTATVRKTEREVEEELQEFMRRYKYFHPDFSIPMINFPAS